MATESKTTTDHEEIRHWAEGLGGRPVQVRGTSGPQEVGVLRIDFPGGTTEEDLEPISWNDWFRKFDEAGLALLYQERKADGSSSTFNKLVHR